MSGEKTEKATPKRRSEARKKGQVAKSIEVSSAIILLFIYLCIQFFGESMLETFRLLFTDFLSDKYLNQSDNFIVNFQGIYLLCLKHFFAICGPILIVGLLTGLVVSYLQVGFLFIPLSMKFDKINPFSGLKRLFSFKSTVDMIKSIVKMLIVGQVVYSEFMSHFNEIPTLVYMDVTQSTRLIWSIISNITWKTALTLFIFGIFDYAYQKWDFEKSLKMSKEEIKQEYKLMEGDPKIKARIRDVQRQMGMRRMMQQVQKADVVITNPTHFAVALQYNQSLGKAPVVIAKGQDFVALRIKEEAKKYKIHMVENRPLAQAIFKATEIDQEIPEELYKAVAEILAVVYKMKR